MKIQYSFFSMIFFLVLFIGIESFTYQKDNLVEFTFNIIALMSVINIIIILRYQKISLSLLFWFFNLLFFYFIPIMQYHLKQFRFISGNIDSYILEVNYMILFWNLLYMIFYYIAYFQKVDNFKAIQLHINNRIIKIVILISIVIIFYMYKKFGLSFFFFRDNESTVHLGKISFLFYNYFFKPLIFFISLIVLVQKKYQQKKYHTFFIVAILFLALILNFPTGSARFYIFALIVSLYVTVLMKPHAQSYIFIIYLVFGIFFSSFLDIFRRLSNFNFDFNFDFNYFFKGHFDAYENFILTVKYTVLHGLEYGHTFLSSVLFFVPRSIWPEKDIGSGAMIAKSYISKIYQIDNDNIANPFIAEWYLNFSFFGVILGAILYGYFAGRIDKYFKLKTLNKSFENDILLIFYGFFVGIYFFHLRGDFMSSYAYTIGSFVAYLVALKLMNIKIIKESK